MSNCNPNDEYKSHIVDPYSLQSYIDSEEKYGWKLRSIDFYVYYCVDDARGVQYTENKYQVLFSREKTKKKDFYNER